MLNGLDLFSGIGGITSAISPWVRPVAYCERDQFCQGVLLSRQNRHELPWAPIWDDVRTLDGRTLPPVDIIYGGFPCQDISVAGDGAGLAGQRSGLVVEVLRLVWEIRPAFTFLENVPAIRTRGADIIVKELARFGYDARWCTLSAAEVGAPHLRNRWWLLAADAVRVELWEQQGRGRWPDWKDKAQLAAAGEDGVTTASRAWASEPALCRADDGLSASVDRLRALGNAVVPAQAREAFIRLMGLPALSPPEPPR